MILDLNRFLAAERPHWEALDAMLRHLDAGGSLDVEGAQRLHRLHERAVADLARLATFAAEPESRRALENLVARSYAEIHSLPTARARNARVRPWHWFAQSFPQAVRRHASALGISLAASLVGVAFGAAVTVADPSSRHVTMPFGHADMRPSERVHQDEAAGTNAAVHHQHASFSGMLMTHNTRVSILATSLGMSWGVGTLVLLFYNGVGLGAIGADYILDGQGRFLAGWILPHGSIELPAILIAGQAGLVLAHALLGRGSRKPLGQRMREVAPDVATLLGGVALLLVHAGIVEAFLSQYHEPVLPYAFKIALGSAQAVGLGTFLLLGGRSTKPEATQAGASPNRRPAPMPRP